MTLSGLTWTKRASSGFLFRTSIVIAVLFLSVYLAPRASTRYLILLVGIAGVLVLGRKPELGLLALIISALVVPFSLSTGTQTSVHVAVLLIPLLFILWVAEMLRRRKLFLVPSRTNLPLFFFAISVCLSFVIGNLSWNYFAQTASLQSQLGGLAIFLFSGAVFLLVGNLVKDLRWLKWLTWLFLMLASAYVVGRVVPSLRWLTALFSAGSVGSIFWVWLVALAGGQALFNRLLPGRVRIILVALVTSTMYVGWVLDRSWISGWLPPLVVLFVLIWLYSWRLGLAVTLIGGLGIFIRDPGLLSGLVSLKQYSIDTRFDAWRIMFQNIIPIDPLLGLGPANYYFYTPLFPILGYYVNFNSHNQYVDILAQTGIVGLVVFDWLMVAIGRVAWNLRNRVTDEFSRAYVYACLGGLAGTLYAGMHGDWFIPFVYNIGMKGFRASMLAWLFLGGLVALEQLVNKHEDKPTVAH